jgi:hypothetical protein
LVARTAITADARIKMLPTRGVLNHSLRMIIHRDRARVLASPRHRSLTVAIEARRA